MTHALKASSMIGGWIALLTVSMFFFTAPSVNAASVCPVGKLYITPWCGPCTKVLKDATDSITALEEAGRLEVFNIDTDAEGFIGDSLPELQLFDRRETTRMLELFQTNPPENPPQHLIVKDASAIVPRLNELAMETCSSGLAESFTQLSARGVSSSVIDSLSNAVSGMFSFVVWGFTTLITLVTG